MQKKHEKHKSANWQAVELCPSWKVLNFVFGSQHKLRPAGFEWQKELEEKVDDLDPTEDGEASEEPHGASNQTQRCLSRHLLICLTF